MTIRCLRLSCRHKEWNTVISVRWNSCSHCFKRLKSDTNNNDVISGTCLSRRDVIVTWSSICCTEKIKTRRSQALKLQSHSDALRVKCCGHDRGTDRCRVSLMCFACQSSLINIHKIQFSWFSARPTSVYCYKSMWKHNTRKYKLKQLKCKNDPSDNVKKILQKISRSNADDLTQLLNSLL